MFEENISLGLEMHLYSILCKPHSLSLFIFLLISSSLPRFHCFPFHRTFQAHSTRPWRGSWARESEKEKQSWRTKQHRKNNICTSLTYFCNRDEQDGCCGWGLFGSFWMMSWLAGFIGKFLLILMIFGIEYSRSEMKGCKLES